MVEISSEWLATQFPELTLFPDPIDPSEKALDFFLTQQGDARLGLFSFPTRGESGFDPDEAKRFWPKLRLEFQDFLCTDSKRYAALRAELASRSAGSEAVILSTITAAVAGTLGATIASLVPLVALCLYAAARIGVAAYCRIIQRGPSDDPHAG